MKIGASDFGPSSHYNTSLAVMTIFSWEWLKKSDSPNGSLFAGKTHSKRLKMTQREAEELVKKAADSQISEEETSLIAPST